MLSRRAFLGAAAGAGVMLPSELHAAPLLEDTGAAHGLEGTRATDIVIVGAGLAGLTAARRLSAKGVRVVVLEARQRVGGRTLSYELRDGRVIDVGGQWVGPIPGETTSSTIPGQAVQRTQHRVFDLAKSLGIHTFKTYDSGSYVNETVSGLRTTDSGTRLPIDVGDVGAAETVLLWNQMAKQIDPTHPWDSPSREQALDWDSLTVDSWMRQNLIPPGQGPGSETYALTTLAAQSVSGPCDPRDMSFLDMLVAIATAGTIDNMINTGGGAQDSRFIGGSQRISIKLAAGLGDRVVLGAPVRSISQNRHGVTVSGDGFSVKGKAVIVALPPTLTGRIHYDPPMSEFDGGTRDQLVQRTPMGSTIKVQAFYPHPYWREQGLAGQATSDRGPITSTFDNTPFTTDAATTSSPDVSPGALVGFMDAGDAREWAQKSMAERRKATEATFARFFPGGPDAIGYLEMNWSLETYTGGCYGVFFAPGVWTSYGPALTRPVGRIHWAGSDISPVWNGYMDGAVHSGEVAATEVLEQLAHHEVALHNEPPGLKSTLR
ncbi:MAG TPA: FAD-dependent oxidoreductase [Mycobacteriales bacterium]|nr:FAD-dependent oxidoreductase [Mycobacteriales bacterium]